MGAGYERLRGLMRDLDLHTVCEEARCPNLGECWNRGTATFMILGDVCTRACGFCAVKTGLPGLPPDLGEAARVADAVARMGLRHAVITSVNRDDQEDGGAAVFAACIREVRARVPGCAVEVLIPDFKGHWAALARRARGPARHPEPQHGDGAAPLPAGAAGRALRALAGAAPARPRRPGCSPRAASWSAWARSGTRCWRPLRAHPRAAGTDILTVGPVPPAEPSAPADPPLLHARRSSPGSRPSRLGLGYRPRGVGAAGALLVPRGGARPARARPSSQRRPADRSSPRRSLALPLDAHGRPPGPRRGPRRLRCRPRPARSGGSPARARGGRPIARRTCDGSSAAGRAGRAGGHGQPLRSRARRGPPPPSARRRR